MKPTRQFDPEARKAIAAAVTEAEQGNSGEIVPVVAARSGRYDRAEDVVGVLTAIICVAGYWSLGPVLQTGWAPGGPNTPLWPLLVCIVAGTFVGTALATRFRALALPFIRRDEMREEVERRAHEVFFRQRLRHTRRASGVLIFVSLYEHMVHVVGDDGVNEQISTEQWQEVVDLVTTGLREGNPKAALTAGIERCGELLDAHFASDDPDGNEIDDALILLDD